MRKGVKTAAERRKYPIGYNWKKERRLERMRERDPHEDERSQEEQRREDGEDYTIEGTPAGPEIPVEPEEDK